MSIAGTKHTLTAYLPQRLPPRTDAIIIRVSAKERAQLERAAKRSGLRLSTWLRAVGLKAATKGKKT
jgi:hypothetical protein